MHATCNEIAGDCAFNLIDPRLDQLGEYARAHESDTGHMVTIYRDHSTVPRTEWEIAPGDAQLLTLDVAERLAGLIEVAILHGNVDRARDLVPVLLHELTAQTNVVATADPRRYAAVARVAQGRVDQTLAEVATTVTPPVLRGPARNRVIAAA